jgi:hypothetical protein
MHTKDFLLGKHPYTFLYLTTNDKREIVLSTADLISRIDISIVNVIIDKERIRNVETCDVLKTALVYNIQCIENSILAPSKIEFAALQSNQNACLHSVRIVVQWS